MSDAHLIPNADCPSMGASFQTCRGTCAAPVKQHPTSGRWYITMFHPGFNSAANNRTGYASENAARNAIAAHNKPRR